MHVSETISPADKTDAHARDAALALGVALPTDTVLYLILPMYADQFGVTFAQAGILLAANRLVRIVGYGWVAKCYARYGDRPTATLAVASAVLCSLAYASLSGFWLLLAARLLWGLSFAALNLGTQALATAEAKGASQRMGRSRALIATGPMLALPLGAILAEWVGPRPVFFLLAAVAACGLALTRRLPAHAYPAPARARRFSLPTRLDAWAFMEGLVLDGLFIIGLSYLGKSLMPEGAVLVAGVLLALRYLAEILLSPSGGRAADRFGPERMLLLLAVCTALALIGFGAGWLWPCAAAILILRALQLPLLPPLVAKRHPGPGRVQALVARSVWRDIGAGVGPLLAGVVLPLAPPLWIYGCAALLLAAAALLCIQEG